jgi:hypothetical protein
LAADEALDRHGNGAINVLRGAVLGEAHPAEGLADADDRFEVADLKHHMSVCGEVRGGNGNVAKRTVMG